MKKIFLTTMMALVTVLSVAQEIKIKKGQILLDEKPIGKVEAPKLKEYKISNLDGTNAIMAYMRVGSSNNAFIEIKNEATNKTNQLDFVKFSPFNVDRSIVQTLFAKQMITANGIDLLKINTFLEGNSTGLSQKYGYIKQEDIDAEAKKADSFKISIDDNGTIFQKTAKNQDTIIGRIKMTLNNSGGTQKYEVADLDNYIIATWFAERGQYEGYNNFLNQELITFDKKVFPVKFDNSGNLIGYKMSKDVTARNIVIKLLLNGYTLKHQGKQAVKEIRTEQQANTAVAINTEKSASKNIYEQNGYVINEKGEKREGPITIEFESIKAATSNGMADMTAYGKTVVLKYNDEKGRNKTETFKSKNGIKFCVDNKGNQECYLGLKTIGNTMAAAASLNSLSFDFSSFYKVIYENNGCVILIDPLTTSDFILKIPTQEKGLYTNKSSIEKLKINFSEYTKCYDLIFENYDFKTKEGLIKVLEEYQTKCKK